MIKVRYSAVDGFNKLKSFKTLKGARKYAQAMVGKNPDFGSYYAISGDGIGKIEVLGVGCKLKELFGDEAPAPMSEDEAMDAAWASYEREQAEYESAAWRAAAEKPRSRDPRCTCSEQQLALVGCNCVECDDIPF